MQNTLQKMLLQYGASSPWINCTDFLQGIGILSDCPLTPAPLHYPAFHVCGQEYSWIENISSKGKHRENVGVVGVGIHMPLLVTVPPGPVAFAFYKSQHEAIGISLNVKMCESQLFQVVPWDSIQGTKMHAMQKWTLPLPPSIRACIFFVDVKSHLFFPNMVMSPSITFLSATWCQMPLVNCFRFSKYLAP
jgi:hypothetical protein